MNELNNQILEIARNIMPTEQDIFDLKSGKLSAEQFDRKVWSRSSQTYMSQEQENY